MEISGIGVVSAFAAGVISFLSPCVLPLVPGYLSFMANQSLDDVERHVFSRERLAIFGISLCFVLGFSLVFILLGAGATALGGLLSTYRYEANIIGGVIIIIFGIFMLGIIKWNWLQREFRYHGGIAKGSRAISAFLLGFAFAFGWTPCIGPILGAILTVSATSEGAGVTLLAIYSLGLGVPFVVAALFTDWSLHHMRKARRVGPWIHKIAGVLLILMGIAMITGYLSNFAFWLLEVFPWLGGVG